MHVFSLAIKVEEIRNYLVFIYRAKKLRNCTCTNKSNNLYEYRGSACIDNDHILIYLYCFTNLYCICLIQVTHCFFRDGRMSTYKRAIDWKVPLVCVLWIEACKAELRQVPLKGFEPYGIDKFKEALSLYHPRTRVSLSC